MTIPPKSPSIFRPVSQELSAPPAYRPHAGVTAQPKTAASLQVETRPAPPVFRPPGNAAVMRLVPALSIGGPPVAQRQESIGKAPLVYRPQSNSPVMRATPAAGTIPPPVYRPNASPIVPSIQPKMAHTPEPRGAAPAVWHPATWPAMLSLPYGPFSTVQRMEAVVMEDEITGDVEVEKTGDEVPAVKLGAIKLVIAAAVKGQGKARSNADLVILEKILATEGVRGAQPKNSEGTYAIGKHNDTVYSTGSGKFEEEVDDNTPVAYTVRKLGNREDFIHGESTLVKDGGAVTAVAATQDCCLFCYGYLESRAIGHQKLRGSPFPKGWIHPSGTFTLKQVNPQTGPKGPLVWITFNGSSRLYRVD